MPSVILLVLVYTMPESPWCLLRRALASGSRKYYNNAFWTLCSVRHTKLQAARDLFLLSHLLKAEQRYCKQHSLLEELLVLPLLRDFFVLSRNRRAIISSSIMIIFQQVSSSASMNMSSARGANSARSFAEFMCLFITQLLSL